MHEEGPGGPRPQWPASPVCGEETCSSAHCSSPLFRASARPCSTPGRKHFGNSLLLARLFSSSVLPLRVCHHLTARLLQLRLLTPRAFPCCTELCCRISKKITAEKLSENHSHIPWGDDVSKRSRVVSDRHTHAQVTSWPFPIWGQAVLSPKRAFGKGVGAQDFREAFGKPRAEVGRLGPHHQGRPSPLPACLARHERCLGAMPVFLRTRLLGGHKTGQPVQSCVIIR